MTDSTQRLIRDLFDGASQLPEAEQRSWVEAHAQGNIEVVSNVLRLLHASSASGHGFRAVPATQEGMPIGPYRALKDLGTAEPAADVEQFEKGQPVLARGDGAGDKVGKSPRRKRLRIAALLLIGIFIAGAGGAYYFHRHENDAVQQKEEVKVELQKAVQRIDDLTKKAQTNATKAKAPLTEGETSYQHLAHIRNGVADFASDYRAEVPGILEADTSTHDKVAQLAQKSLHYFAVVEAVAGDDPGTVAALGRAYQTVAKSQWSPAGTPSLNDPTQAKQTYQLALRSLEATDALKNNWQIKSVINEILSDPATQQFRQALDASAKP